MKTSIHLLILFLLTTTPLFCESTVPVDIKEGLPNVRITFVDGSLAVALKTSTLIPSKKGSIIEKQSYAIDGSGKRYGIVAEPNEYARNYPERSYFTSDYVWLKDAHGRKLNWKDGNWKIVLVLKTSENESTYKATFDLNAN